MIIDNEPLKHELALAFAAAVRERRMYVLDDYDNSEYVDDNFKVNDEAIVRDATQAFLDEIYDLLGTLEV